MNDVNLEKGFPHDAPTSLHISHKEPATKIASFGIPLYSYPSVPTFLQGNPFITDGYRAHLNPKLCVKSACILSNETVNIWSHLLGLAYFTFLQFTDNFQYLPNNRAEFGDYLTFNLMNFCFQVCMFCSAGYHMFSCQSEVTSKRWLRLDLVGVSVGMCGCYFPGAYYAFYCEKFWQTAYMGAMFLLLFTCLLAQAHSDFLSYQWYFRRLLLYSAFIFASVVPVMHWVLQNSGFAHPFVQLFMPKILMMYVLVLVGGLFYISQFPEKIFPGKLNIFGSSHQWWHIMVVLAFTWAHYMGEVVFIYWRTHTCQVHSSSESSDIWSLYSFLGIKAS